MTYAVNVCPLCATRSGTHWHYPPIGLRCSAMAGFPPQGWRTDTGSGVHASPTEPFEIPPAKTYVYTTPSEARP